LVWVWVSIGYTGHHPWPGCSRELSQGAKNKNSLWLRAKCSAQFVDWQGLRIGGRFVLQGKMKSEMLPCHIKQKNVEKKWKVREREQQQGNLSIFICQNADIY